MQITERCNLHCAHCFVSAGREGLDLALEDLRERVLPRLRAARVSRVTLTGGEPFAHPDVVDIVRVARGLRMGVTLCTNGTLVSEEAMDTLAALGRVSVNVSLDGFSARGHGKFRGAPASFERTVATVRALGERGLLKGLLATPNALADASEYEELCALARSCGAEYVLMNPLASMGRGAGTPARRRRGAAAGYRLADVGARGRRPRRRADPVPQRRAAAVGL